MDSSGIIDGRPIPRAPAMAAGAENRVKSANMETKPAYDAHSAEAAHRATVAAGFVRGMLSAIPAARARTLLRAAGLPASAMEEPNRTPIADYAALYNRVVADMGDEGFGLFSAALRPGTFEFLCRGTLGAGTLDEALARAAHFMRLVLEDLELTIVREGQE